MMRMGLIRVRWKNVFRARCRSLNFFLFPSYSRSSQSSCNSSISLFYNLTVYCGIIWFYGHDPPHYSILTITHYFVSVGQRLIFDSSAPLLSPKFFCLFCPVGCFSCKPAPCGYITVLYARCLFGHLGTLLRLLYPLMKSTEDNYLTQNVRMAHTAADVGRKASASHQISIRSGQSPVKPSPTTWKSRMGLATQTAMGPGFVS